MAATGIFAASFSAAYSSRGAAADIGIATGAPAMTLMRCDPNAPSIPPIAPPLFAFIILPLSRSTLTSSIAVPPNSPRSRIAWSLGSAILPLSRWRLVSVCG